MTTLPQIRCHVQPSGSVFTQLGCSNKILVAHEDYFRPHCQKFFNAYKMRLEEGEYDKELISYWLKKVVMSYVHVVSVFFMTNLLLPGVTLLHTSGNCGRGRFPVPI